MVYRGNLRGLMQRNFYDENESNWLCGSQNAKARNEAMSYVSLSWSLKPACDSKFLKSKVSMVVITQFAEESTHR